MALGLLKFGLRKEYRATRHFTAVKPLKKHYDVVIIGAGGHGAAIAYYLARYHGITNVALLDKAYLGGGNTARNTAVIRSNYLTEEGVALERRLSDAQRARMRAAFRNAGPDAVAGFRTVLEAMMDPEMRRKYIALKERGV